MPRVEKTEGGLVYIRPLDRRFEIGDRADVGEELAAYLVEERGDFDVVEGDDSDAATAWAFPDGEELNDLTVDEVKNLLSTGEYDHVLAEIESAEKNGKDRSTVHDAIKARRTEEA